MTVANMVGTTNRREVEVIRNAESRIATGKTHEVSSMNAEEVKPSPNEDPPQEKGRKCKDRRRRKKEQKRKKKTPLVMLFPDTCRGDPVDERFVVENPMQSRRNCTHETPGRGGGKRCSEPHSYPQTKMLPSMLSYSASLWNYGGLGYGKGPAILRCRTRTGNGVVKNPSVIA